MTPKNPMQPFIRDDSGVVRFKANAIVTMLVDRVRCLGVDMNEIAEWDVSQDDRVQFAQLIGYSLSGFHELSYVPDEAALAATRAARVQGMGDVYGCRDNGCGIHSGVKIEERP